LELGALVSSEGAPPPPPFFFPFSEPKKGEAFSSEPDPTSENSEPPSEKKEVEPRTKGFSVAALFSCVILTLVAIACSYGY